MRQWLSLLCLLPAAKPVRGLENRTRSSCYERPRSVSDLILLSYMGALSYSLAIPPEFAMPVPSPTFARDPLNVP